MTMRSSHGAALWCAAVVAAGAIDAGAQDSRSFAVRARRLYPVTAESPGAIDGGMMIVREGRIVAVGRDLDVPLDLPLIEFRDETICPGFVNAAGNLVGPHGGDATASGAYEALDSFDPYADEVRHLSCGTTTMHIDPGGHRLISGVGAVVKLAGEPDERVLARRSDLAVNLGVYGPPNRWSLAFYASSDEAIKPAIRQRPNSRLGQYLELEECIAAATAGGEGVRAAGGAEFDYHLRTLGGAWSEGLPMRIQARRAADVDGALATLKRFNRRGYVVGAGEGARLHAALLEAGVPVVLRIEDAYSRPAGNLGGDPGVYSANRYSAGGLEGVRVALAPAERSGDEDLRMIAALAVRGGMEPDRALAGVTRVAAEIIGVGERVGSLAVGKDADFVVLTGPPIGVESHVRRVYVGGRVAFDAPASDAVVVKAGTVWVGNGQVVHDGSVLVEDGRVRAVGNRVPHPPFAKVIDAGRDGYVVPGFIDAHSHLGLEGDVQPVTPDLSLAATVGVAGREFLRVARSGITTVLLAPYGVANEGGRVAAVKTWGRDREDMLVRETSALKMSLRGKDPLTAIEQVRRAVKAGKDYDEAWNKYAAELKKWEENRAKGVTPEGKPEGETVVEKGRPDPLTGTWSFTLSGAPLPEDVSGTMKLTLTGSRIEGRISVPMADEEVSCAGTLEGNTFVLEIEQDTPIGRPRINGTLDRDDHAIGSVVLGEFSIKFEATRTSKDAPELRVTRQRRRGKDGRPAPPKVDEALEPMRQVVNGRAPLLVDVETAAQIATAVKVLAQELKLPLVLLNAEAADQQADELARDKIGVVLPTQWVRGRRNGPFVQAAELARRGVPLAVQSDSEDGGRNLELNALYGVQQGMGGDAALRALTIDAARMFKVDDRLGSIEPGKDADLLIFTGHPFDAESRLERVLVSGREVPDEE